MKTDRKMKHRSAEVSIGPERAPHRAMFHAMGFTDDSERNPEPAEPLESSSSPVHLGRAGEICQTVLLCLPRGRL